MEEVASVKRTAVPIGGEDLTMLKAPIRIRAGETGRLVVQFPYSPDDVAKIKSVPGRRWHAKERHWTVPQGDETLCTLLRLFPRKPVDVDPALDSGCDIRTVQELLGHRDVRTTMIYTDV
ncbi:MAG: hypothetical protein NTNFB02_23870 [Nitrospira sp.]